MNFKAVLVCFLLLFCHWKSRVGAAGIYCLNGKVFYVKDAANSKITLFSIQQNVRKIERMELKNVKLFKNDSLSRFSSLKVISLKKNGITEIPANLFQSKQIVEIYLGYNSITFVPPTLFDQTPNLEVLWLKGNKLEIISSETFTNTTNLKALILSHNKIKKITYDLFFSNEKLEVLAIDNNQIQDLKADLFERIPNLITLKINKNKLPFFNPECFIHLKKLQFFYTSGFSDCCSAKARINSVRCTYNEPKGREETCGVKILPDQERKFIGRVKINDKDGKFKTLCDTKWTKEDADTVCREVGYAASAEPLLPEYVTFSGLEQYKSVPYELDCASDKYSTLACTQIKKPSNWSCSDKDNVGVRCQTKAEHLWCNNKQSDVCTCPGGKKIDCSNKDLVHIPWVNEGFGGNILDFDLSENKLRWIFVDILKLFPNLKTLGLSWNRLGKIPEGLFAHSKKLEEINFARNEIRFLPEKLLINATSLRKMNFAHNSIESIPQNFFPAASLLNDIDLSSNKLNSFPEKVFFNLGQLRNLSLRNNIFKTLKPYYFEGLVSLDFLDLSEMRSLVGIKWRPILDNLPSLSKLETNYFSDCCFVALSRTDVKCISPINTFSSCSKMLKSDILRYLMWALVVLTFGGNLFSLLMRMTETDKNKVQNMFVCSLCVSDMLMGVYLAGIISKEIATRGEYYRHDLEWRSGGTCYALGAISILSSEVSVLTLVFIAHDRFLHIVYAIDFKKINYRTGIVLLILTWVLCTVIAVLPAVVKPYFRDQSNNVGFYGTSSICMPLQLPGQGATASEYCLAVFGVLNFLAAVYLIVSYIRMFYASYKSARDCGNKARSNHHAALAKRFAAVVFTDVCCWVPIAMLLFLSLGRAVSDNDNVLYAWFSVCIIPINSAINPILYTISTPLFWKKINEYVIKFTRNWRVTRRENADQNQEVKNQEGNTENTNVTQAV